MYCLQFYNASSILKTKRIKYIIQEIVFIIQEAMITIQEVFSFIKEQKIPFKKHYFYFKNKICTSRSYNYNSRSILLYPRTKNTIQETLFILQEQNM